MSGKEIAKRISIVIICLLAINGLKGQARWAQTYLDGENPFGESLVEYYDKGYLLAGRFGPNYPKYGWLIKADIDGNELWKKVIGVESETLVISNDITIDKEGDIFLVGSTSYYNEIDYDPFILKLNNCGEKEWCKVFYEEGLNFSISVIATQDGGCVTLLGYLGYFADMICLVKFDSQGQLIWKHCYNSTDTSLNNQDAKDLIKCPDGGYLISGSCYYQDPDPPHYFWPKPYFIKTDSVGNFEWETVAHIDNTDVGGRAWNTVINSDSNYYYSSLSHYYFDSGNDAASLLKMDMSGNVIDIYDLAPPDDYGKMISLKFITDTTLAASAVWGSELNALPPRPVILDTLGNILYENPVLDNEWMGHVEITYDKKILYQTNLNEGDNFSTYLFKFNQNLESDTVYTHPFTYDSLCNGEIVSDTIVQDDCGIIVGDVEIYRQKKENKLVIYPNPAGEKFTVCSRQPTIGSWRVEVYDLFGRRVEELQVPKGQTEIEVMTTGWKKGLYVIKARGKSGMIGSGKVILK